eukprot:3209260-Pyramimonas_sp.AAC.1
MDGSCRRHAVRELSRAGWAVVIVSQAGERLGVFKGPLWAPWPRTPQGSEFGALAWTRLYSEGPSDCYSDCSNVVSLMNLREADAISGKRQYAGLVNQARQHFGSNVSSFVKAAAHRDLDEEGLSARERFLRVGNHYADVAAKEAVLLHPSWSPF